MGVNFMRYLDYFPDKHYQVLQLVEQQDKSYKDISKILSLSKSRIAQIYREAKKMQLKAYISHINEASENKIDYKEIYKFIMLSYGHIKYGGTYLEKEYYTILHEFRNGEPGSEYFIKDLPMIIDDCESNDDVLLQIVLMKEKDKMSFKEIGNRLNLTKEKASHLYEHYYHRKIIAAQQTILEKTQINIFFNTHLTGASKMQWQWVLDSFGDLL